MIAWLHAVLIAVCIQGPSLLTEKGVGPPYLEGERGPSGLQQLPWYNTAQPGKVLAHLLLMLIRSHLLRHQRPEQSGFTRFK